MDRGQRVTIIRSAAETLQSQPWPDIDLVLEQFGFPTSDVWREDERSYLLTMLKDGTDDDLIALNAYLHPATSRFPRRNRRS